MALVVSQFFFAVVLGVFFTISPISAVQERRVVPKIPECRLFSGIVVCHHSKVEQIPPKISKVFWSGEELSWESLNNFFPNSTSVPCLVAPLDPTPPVDWGSQSCLCILRELLLGFILFFIFGLLSLLF